MRLLAAMLLGLLVAPPAWAQSDRNAELPPGQTLLNGLIGKDQASPSKEGRPLLGGSADQETQEQREHYRTNRTVRTPTPNRSAPGDAGN